MLKTFRAEEDLLQDLYVFIRWRLPVVLLVLLKLAKLLLCL